MPLKAHGGHFHSSGPAPTSSKSRAAGAKELDPPLTAGLTPPTLWTQLTTRAPGRHGFGRWERERFSCSRPMGRGLLRNS